MNNIKRRIIIAGAPRCGTTSLFNYLNDHPQIFGLPIKETCYFLDQGYFDDSYNQMKLLPSYHKNGMKGYDALFSEATKGQFRLDATPDYLYQQTFLDILPRLSPTPLVVFCLREPSARVYSLFKFAKSRLGIVPNETSFSTFLEQVNNKDKVIQKHNILKNVITHSKYVHYIDRISRIIGKENIQIVLNENLIQQPQAYLQTIVARCDMETAFYDAYNFEHFNESYEVKTQFFRKLYERLPLPYSLRYGDNKLKKILKSWHHKLNASKNKEQSEEEKIALCQLKKSFQVDNELLSTNYQLDLSIWKDSKIV